MKMCHCLDLFAEAILRSEFPDLLKRGHQFLRHDDDDVAVLCLGDVIETVVNDPPVGGSLLKVGLHPGVNRRDVVRNAFKKAMLLQEGEAIFILPKGSDLVCADIHDDEDAVVPTVKPYDDEAQAAILACMKATPAEHPDYEGIQAKILRMEGGAPL